LAIGVFLAHPRQVDANDDRLGGFPTFASQESPCREGFVWLLVASLLCCANVLSKRTATAGKHLAPALGKAFPCTRDTASEVRPQLSDGIHRELPLPFRTTLRRKWGYEVRFQDRRISRQRTARRAR